MALLLLFIWVKSNYATEVWKKVKRKLFKLKSQRNYGFRIGLIFIIITEILVGIALKPSNQNIRKFSYTLISVLKCFSL